ncbi:zinc finger protein 239-like [Solea solea]|uniref:zinc finger protein 239-like n=1 Tax=Solea solea TaxID=90069 RepID=UPI002729757B|nr:zinc finger protein 239-like [Solea solea]
MSKVNISPVVSEAAMSSLQFLSELICERLSAAAEEIFRAFERTVVEYEDEVGRQRKLLEIAWKPQLKLQRIELWQQHIHEEEEVLTDQERNSSRDQEEPESLQIKEDQGEICTSQEDETKPEAETIMLTPEPEHMEPEPVTDHQLVSHRSPVAQTGSKCLDSKPQKRSGKKNLKKSLKNKKTKTKTRIYKKSLKCDTCGILFSTHYQVNLHMRVHTGERPFSCEICDKGFKRPYHLSLHKRTHTGEKPYTCKTCAKTFGRFPAMKAHMRSHTGERPHFCEMCGRRFFQLTHLKNHIRTHTGEKPFACYKCEKMFSQISTMKTHIKIHRDEGKFSCDTCGESFEQRCEFEIHMKTHKDEKSTSPSAATVGEKKPTVAKGWKIPG